MTKVAFTGHRPKDLYGYDTREPYKIVARKIAENLKTLDNELIVITGGAQGIDQLAFWAAEHLKKEGWNVKNILAVPFKGQELRWSQTGMFSQTEYRKMLTMADKVVYLSDNSQDAVRKLDERNHWMVDKSDVLVCVTPYVDIEHRPGGTGNCVRYAVSRNHPYLIWKI